MASHRYVYLLGYLSKQTIKYDVKNILRKVVLDVVELGKVVELVNVLLFVDDGPLVLVELVVEELVLDDVPELVDANVVWDVVVRKYSTMLV
eukprot:868043-Amphidinium_carterae.1